MSEQIQGMAVEEGHATEAIGLLVRANAEAEQTAEGVGVDFTGTMEQVVGDAKWTAEMGAAELVLDAPFMPGVAGAEDLLQRMEEFYRLYSA